MQLILIPYSHSSAAIDLTSPMMADLETEYVCCASPPNNPVTLAVHRMQPLLRGIMTRVECLIPATTPRTLILMTWSKTSRLRSTILLGVLQATPALLYMMSSWLCLDMVKSTASETSDSLVTSQAMKVALGPSSFAVCWPSWCWISAITTLAPLLINFAAVAFPIPLAAPVISATFSSSFLYHKIKQNTSITICKLKIPS